ncbi:MAG: hypothetical protein ACOH2H_20495 [Cypionkella sp.]
MMTHDEFPQRLGVFLAEIGEDATRWAQTGIDLATLLIIGTLIYLTSLDPAAAGLHGRPMFGVGARMEGVAGVTLTSSHAPSSCGLTNDLLASAHRSCIDAMVLEPAAI